MMRIQTQMRSTRDDTGVELMRKTFFSKKNDGSEMLCPSTCSDTHEQTKVFIITGDEELRGTLKYALDLYGMQVSFFPGNTKALSRATVNPFDCIILDCDIPGMDNGDHVRRLRGQFANAVIIGLSKEDRGVAYLQAGMNDFLQKPFPPYRLAMMMDGGDILN